MFPVDTVVKMLYYHSRHDWNNSCHKCLSQISVTNVGKRPTPWWHRYIITISRKWEIPQNMTTSCLNLFLQVYKNLFSQPWLQVDVKLKMCALWSKSTLPLSHQAHDCFTFTFYSQHWKEITFTFSGPEQRQFRRSHLLPPCHLCCSSTPVM